LMQRYSLQWPGGNTLGDCVRTLEMTIWNLKVNISTDDFAVLLEACPQLYELRRASMDRMSLRRCPTMLQRDTDAGELAQ